MIQDIDPYKFHPEYQPRIANPEKDFFLCYSKDKVLLKGSSIPHVKDVLHVVKLEELQFLFSIDDIAFYNTNSISFFIIKITIFICINYYTIKF